MKRVFTLLALTASVFLASAKDYTDVLEVSINNVVSATQTATISLDQQANGKYSFSLKNFTLNIGGQQTGIGTVQVDSVTTVSGAGGLTTLIANQTIKIKDGDGVSPSGIWIGESLGEVPVRLVAEQRGEELYAVININMAGLGQSIRVVFGNGGYQVRNSGFENFHKENTTIDEPNNWHSFASCTGSWASFVRGTAHTFVSGETRPGSAGSHSVMVTSTSIIGIIANGTITTGRMNAGAISATDTRNHARLDMSLTETDANGDPFYAAINGHPDSLSVWVKFIQGTPSAAHPYATVSAALTDGTYYQDPQDKTYTNVAATAKNNTIATAGGRWQRIAVPFSYTANNVDSKAMLVTISTNADAGQGSIDTLYVDDFELMYGQDITVNGITINGQSLELKDTMEYRNMAQVIYTPDMISVDTKAAKVLTTVETTTAGTVAHVTVASDDLKTFKTYVININGATTGISTVDSASDVPEVIYNLRGQRVDTMTPGNVYIVKQGDKVVKVLKK